MNTRRTILKSQFVIGASASGSGKTTITLALLKALGNRGLTVQPYKCGPDYIDPKYHTLACGRESVNLDIFMGSPGHVRSLYADSCADADVCVTEGVMGLFDGYDKDCGSSADIARLLEIPVILTVDARAAAYSAAPLLYGFANFRKGVNVAGVIFNRVASESHYSYLRQAALDAGVTPLGFMPAQKDFSVPSRHLGLSLKHLNEYSPVIDAMACNAEEHIDIDALLDLTRCPTPERQAWQSGRNGKLKIAVTRDEAFNFTYKANIDRLAGAGSLEFFSPLQDTRLPEADLVYLPGGYPEFFLPQLSSNISMLRAVSAYASSGGRILAECGGMMYLCRTIISEDGRRWPVCGVLPLDATMEGMRLHLGYRTVSAGDFSVRGHEFHYSSIIGNLPSVAVQRSAEGRAVDSPLYRVANVLAGYTHLYWAETDPLLLFEYFK